ncbi:MULTISPECIES: hypothetical protein [Nocardia]|uniref:hypothetical protein n=1 Tax=Nocardia TaxID=1817 RepID=UPI0012F633B8|nr:hypothetical protein [Nocardia araoensis]
MTVKEKKGGLDPDHRENYLPVSDEEQHLLERRRDFSPSDQSYEAVKAARDRQAPEFYDDSATDTAPDTVAIPDDGPDTVSAPDDEAVW